MNAKLSSIFMHSPRNSTLRARRERGHVGPAVLEELEPIRDAARVAHEQQAASAFRLVGLDLLLCHLGAELYPATRDAAVVNVNAAVELLEVVAREGLADVGGEGAAGLVVNLACKAEVVAPMRV